MKNDVFTALEKKSINCSEAAVRGLTEMFGLSDAVKVITLPISKLKEKDNHPFKVYEDEKLNALADSIKNNGLMEPIIVRVLDGGTYEILAGHRRVRASCLLGKTEIRAIVVKADDELANRIMISTNFQQRDSYLPSEIAKSYLIRYTDLKNRKRAIDENSTGWNSAEKIDKIMEKEFSTSKSKVYMYLRINHLLPELLAALDNKKLNLKIAVELSYLRENEQHYVYELVYNCKLFKLDFKKATVLKQESARREIDEKHIQQLLEAGDKPQKAKLSFSASEIKRYESKFQSMNAMKKAIIDFLDNY